MRTNVFRPLLALFAILLAAMGFAGTLTVTSPTDGQTLGKSNTLTFNITGATVKVNVRATITTPTNSTTFVETSVTPDNDGKASGSLSLNFNDTAATGQYTIVVTATEPGNTYTPTTLHENVDVVAPKFIELSPTSGGFINGIIHIRATVTDNETSVKDWRVQVNNQDVQTGSGNIISVDYDPTGSTTDGTQTITIKVHDQADNETTKTISLTLDRIRPTVTIAYPRSDTKFANGADVTVLIDIVDASTTSVDKTGIDIIAKKTDGTYITRVTLVSLRGTNGTTQRWTGRIKYKKGLLPSQFVLSARVVDRAGNVATLQEVTVRYGK